MTREQELIKNNLERVNRIFNAVDFGKVCLTSVLITNMNDFYTESKKYLNDNKIEFKLEEK